MKPHHHTAFPEMEAALGRAVREAMVDHDAFLMPLKVCELAICRATCCHDGVWLDDEEREVIGEVIEAHEGKLDSYGWRETEIFTRREGRWKSVTIAEEKPGEFPTHFPRTRCVFLDTEHRCVLQRLAMDEDKHPWFWKPVSCWMHPLLLKPGSRPLLTLATKENDAAAFSSHTPCGIPCPGGPPTRETLAAELDLLERIAGRAITAELAAPDV